MLRTSAKGPGFGAAVIGLETKTSVEDRGIPHIRGRGTEDQGKPRGRGRSTSNRGISRGRGRVGDDHGGLGGSSRGWEERDHEGSRGGGRGRGMLGREGFEGRRGRGMSNRGAFEGGRGRGMLGHGGFERGRGRGMEVHGGGRGRGMEVHSGGIGRGVEVRSGGRGRGVEVRSGGRGRGVEVRSGRRGRGMEVRSGGRGRGMGDRGAFGRGRGRGRGRGVEVQKGFSGSSQGRDVANRGGRGGLRVSNGNFRGIDRGGRSRGRGVVIRRDRGGFRGSRGSLPHQSEPTPQIKKGLQLVVIFKETPVAIQELEKLPGFHSINTAKGPKERCKMILFKDMKSREAAEAILNSHQNVQATMRRGVAAVSTTNSSSLVCQVHLAFSDAVDEVAVEKLVDGIKKVEILTEKFSYALQYATPEQALIAAQKLKCQKKKMKLEVICIEKYDSKELLELTGRLPDDQVMMSQVYVRFKREFNYLDTIKNIEQIAGKTEATPLFGCTVQFATREEAVDAVKKLKSKIGVNALRLVSLNWKSLMSFRRVDYNKIILRDVPENVTLKDFVTVVPKAISVVVYKRTFPASEFCHAIVGFENPTDVAELLKLTDLKIAGNKVFIFPAHNSLMNELRNLGNLKRKEVLKDVEAVEEPSSKKIKMDNGCETGKDENAEDEGVEDEDAVDEGVEEEDFEDNGVVDEDVEDDGVVDENADDEHAEYDDAECEEVEDENAECDEDVEDENAECEEVEDENAECEEVKDGGEED